MAFWWEDYHSTNRIPSLDTGLTNAKTLRTEESIFESKNFKNISSMFTEFELKVAKFKAQNRTDADIAEILNISVSEVEESIKFMKNVYRKTFPVEEVKTNYRTISSKKR